MIYLDHSSTSFPKPEGVYTSMDRFYREHGVNPGRSGYDLCREAGEMVDETRKLLTGLFHGRDWSRLCFGYNATDALNLVIRGMVGRGDHVVTTVLEHNSVLRPLHHMSLQEGVEVEHVPCGKDGFIDPDDVRRRFRKDTRLVIVNHASNVFGTVQPVAEIGARCKEAGIPFVIDASQTAGLVPIDVEAMNVDVVVFTGHKSLMGPTGIGGLYVREGVEVRLTRAGGTGVRSEQRTHLEEYPYRLEYGTINVLGVAGLNAGVRWVCDHGTDRLLEQEMRLMTLLRDGVKGIEGVTTYCQDDLTHHIPVFLFNIDGFQADEAGPLLDVDHGIACRTGLHCAPLVHEHLGTKQGAIRFSLGPFITESDVHFAIAAVREVASLRNRKGSRRATLPHSGAPLEVNEDGFLVRPEVWNDDVALLLAREAEGVAELTADHWKVIRYIRGFYEEHGLAPLIRKICKTTGITLKRIYALFPSGPAKGACKVAGLPSADGCV